MAQKTKIGRKFMSHKRQFWPFRLKAIMWQLIELESCSNPSDPESLVVWNKKIFLGLGFLVVHIMIEEGLAFLMTSWADPVS